MYFFIKVYYVPTYLFIKYHKSTLESRDRRNFFQFLLLPDSIQILHRFLWQCSILIQSTKCNCTSSVFIHRFNPKMPAGNAWTSKLLLQNFATESDFYFLFFRYVCLPFSSGYGLTRNVRRLNVCRSELCFFLFHFFRPPYLTVCLSWPLIYVTAHFCFAKIQETGNFV